MKYYDLLPKRGTSQAYLIYLIVGWLRQSMVFSIKYQLSCYVYINRYVLRVVSASLKHNETMVNWETANGATTGSQKVARGQFVEITNPRATEPMKVDCSSSCLVMLYNTGTPYFDQRVT